MSGTAVTLPPPIALAQLTDTLTPRGIRVPVFEPKWDGYRAISAAGRLWSRRGVDLTRYFPDLAPVLAARLPPDVVLDGELVAWDTDAGRLDFAGLQARITAGRRLFAAVARRPAQMVCFDVLAAEGVDLRPRPLAERRLILECLLSGISPPIALCQQTSDVAVAAEWLQTLTAGGLEGVVIKDATAPYPTKEGQRVWRKVKTRTTLDMLAIGIVGDPAAPTTLVLSIPATGDDLHAAGATTRLSRAVARSIAPLLTLTGEVGTRRSAWGTSDTVEVRRIVPLVVEVSADASIDNGVLRHAARLLRARPDLGIEDVMSG